MMSGNLPYWLEHWLGIPAGPGEGTVWSLDVVWPLPAWGAIVLLVLALLYVVGIYSRENPKVSLRRRLALAAVRLTLIGIVLLMLGQVSLA